MPTLFEDEEVILYLLRRRRMTEDGMEHVIANTSFVRCKLLGPMHVRLADDVLVENCSFVPSASECLTGLDANRYYVGSFLVTGCSFVDCEFDDVRVAVQRGHPLLAAARRQARAAV